MFSWQIDDSIQLELLEPRHTEELFRLTDKNRDYLSRWLPWVNSVQQPEDTANFITKCQQQRVDNQSFQAAIRVEDKLAGVVGHHKIDWTNYCTSLGYWLAETYQGRGIMTKCCSSVVDHAFEVLNVHRVEIHCAVDNQKSQGIPERLGFNKEAVLRDAARLNNQFVDLIVYAALSDKWNGL